MIKLTIYGRLRKFIGQSTFEIKAKSPKEAFSFLINNFVTGTNPFGTPSSNRLRDEIFVIDRKAIENRRIVQFELSAAHDLENRLIPQRVVTRDLFPAVGTFI